MQDIGKLIDFLEDLPEILTEGVQRAIDENKDDIVDLNRVQLQIFGVDASGKPLGEYAQLSKKLREERGLQTDFIDLRFTGESQDSMKIKQKDDTSYELVADTINWDTNRFDDAIGLVDENEDKLTDIIIKQLEFEIERSL